MCASRPVWFLATVLMLCQLCRPSAGLKHNLALEDEHRSFFIVSSFGLLKGGSVTVNVSAFETRHKLDRIGFSLHRSPEESTEYDLVSSPLGRRRRAVFARCCSPSVAVRDVHVWPVASLTQRDGLCLSGAIQNQVEGSDCIFEEAALADLDTMRIEMCSDTGKFTVVRDKLLGVAVDLSFQESGAGRVDTAVISLDTPDAADIYTLAFHVCSKEVPWVDLEIDIIEVNPGPEYLGAGKAPLPTLYGVMAGFFFVAAIAWGATLLKNRESKYFFKLHFLMMALVVVKALSLCFRAVDYHFISTLGTREEGWAILFYIVRFAKGLLLFFTVILVGAGYGFIKHVLSDREKKLFLVVIPLQVRLLGAVAWLNRHSAHPSRCCHDAPRFGSCQGRRR